MRGGCYEAKELGPTSKIGEASTSILRPLWEEICSLLRKKVAAEYQSPRGEKNQFLVTASKSFKQCLVGSENW